MQKDTRDTTLAVDGELSVDSQAAGSKASNQASPATETQITNELSVKKVFGGAWQVFKANWRFLLLVAVTFSLVQLVENVVSSRIQQPILSLVIDFGIFVLNLLMSVGLIRIFVGLVRGEKVALSVLFNQTDRALRYFWTTLVVGFITILGAIFFIVPGVYFALKYFFAPYLVADRNLTVSEAMKLSSKMTKRIKLKLLGLGILAMLINLVGLLALGVGLLVTIPTTYLALAYVYDALLARVDV